MSPAGTMVFVEEDRFTALERETRGMRLELTALRQMLERSTTAEFLTVNQAAEIKKVDPETIRNWIKSGRLYATKSEKRGGHYRILRADLLRVRR